MQIPNPSYCHNCRHFGEWIHGAGILPLSDGTEDGEDAFGHSCKAFPRGIPGDVWTGDVRHDRPVEGDNGIRFEAVDPNGETPAAAASGARD